MKITHGKECRSNEVRLAEIKYTHAFRFVDAHIDGVHTEGKTYIKLYPFNNYNRSFGYAQTGSGYHFVADLQQGGLRVISGGEHVVLLDAELCVNGDLPIK